MVRKNVAPPPPSPPPKGGFVCIDSHERTTDSVVLPLRTKELKDVRDILSDWCHSNSMSLLVKNIFGSSDNKSDHRRNIAVCAETIVKNSYYAIPTTNNAVAANIRVAATDIALGTGWFTAVICGMGSIHIRPTYVPDSLTNVIPEYGASPRGYLKNAALIWKHCLVADLKEIDEGLAKLRRRLMMFGWHYKKLFAIKAIIVVLIAYLDDFNSHGFEDIYSRICMSKIISAVGTGAEVTRFAGRLETNY